MPYAAKIILAGLIALAVAGCGSTGSITTQSTAPAQVAAATRAALPDCPVLKAEIDQLRAAKIPEKQQQAVAKTYTPTAEELNLFPRYNSLVDSYIVQKCSPPLQMAAPAQPKRQVVTKTSAKTTAKVQPKKPPVTATKPAPAAQPADDEPKIEGVYLRIPTPSQ